MVMIIIQIAYITCLVTNDALHAYDAIGVYKINHVAGRVSFHGAGNTVVGWYGHERDRARNI